MSAGIRFSRPSAARARAQADWIAVLDPWRGLGYRPAALGRYLARKARTRSVWIAAAGARVAPSAIAVVDDGFLLGGFISLLAVRPEASGQGIGRALVEHVARRVFATRRWLFVSCDGNNHAALRFYRRLGFYRVGRLPDLVRVGHLEILLRKPAPSPAPLIERAGRHAKFPAGPAPVGYHRAGP